MIIIIVAAVVLAASCTALAVACVIVGSEREKGEEK